MTLTKEILMGEVRKHLNEVVLDGLRVVRLVGCGEDEDDFYYKLDEGYGKRYSCNHTGVYYLTSVGSPRYIKGMLDDVTYNELDRLARLNGAPEVVHFEWEVLGDYQE